MTVVDASVWVSYLLPKDANHVASRAWLSSQLTRQTFVPAIALAEIGGAISRQTGDRVLAYATLEWLLQLPSLSIEAIDGQLGELAAKLSIALELRGADAIYVALAKALDAPLITWDEQQRERASGIIAANNPTLA